MYIHLSYRVFSLGVHLSYRVFSLGVHLSYRVFSIGVQSMAWMSSRYMHIIIYYTVEYILYAHDVV